MPRTRKIPFPDGSEAEAEVVINRATGEYWNEYLLEDRTVLRLKPIVTEVLKVIGQYDNAGNPLYIVSATNVIAIDSPDELRKGHSE